MRANSIVPAGGRLMGVLLAVLLAAAGGTAAAAANNTTAPAAKRSERIRLAAGMTLADTLDAQGSWVYAGSIGRVWRPRPDVVGSDFMPYLSGGRWVETPLGRQFDSVWAWGGLTFHYGRWFRDALYGWVWQPGKVWANAWVNWRETVDDVGWAPVPPAEVACVVPGEWSYVPRSRLALPDLSLHVLTGSAALRASSEATIAVRFEEQPSRCVLRVGEATPVVRGGGSVGGFNAAYTLDTAGTGQQAAVANRFVDRTEPPGAQASIPAESEFHQPIRDVRWSPHVSLPPRTIPPRDVSGQRRPVRY